jgi:hypothetical protein
LLVHTLAKANPKPNPEAAKPLLGKTIQISKQMRYWEETTRAWKQTRTGFKVVDGRLVVGTDHRGTKAPGPVPAHKWEICVTEASVLARS